MDLGASDDGNLDDAKQQNEDEREDECELHDNRASLRHAPFAIETTFWMTELKNAGRASVVDAHEISASATMAAATRTRAYSAAAWPDSFRIGSRRSVLFFKVVPFVRG